MQGLRPPLITHPTRTLSARDRTGFLRIRSRCILESLLARVRCRTRSVLGPGMAPVRSKEPATPGSLATTHIPASCRKVGLSSRET